MKQAKKIKKALKVYIKLMELAIKLKTPAPPVPRFKTDGILYDHPYDGEIFKKGCFNKINLGKIHDLNIHESILTDTFTLYQIFKIPKLQMDILKARTINYSDNSIGDLAAVWKKCPECKIGRMVRQPYSYTKTHCENCGYEKK